MWIDNIVITLLFLLHIAILIFGAGFYFYKNRFSKSQNPVIEIEKMPEESKGFGYISGNSLILNEYGVPYLYKTYDEAKRRMNRVKGVDRIIFQQWDINTKTVLVAEVKHGSNQ